MEYKESQIAKPGRINCNAEMGDDALNGLR